jgi:hypothetical protein
MLHGPIIPNVNIRASVSFGMFDDDKARYVYAQPTYSYRVSGQIYVLIKEQHSTNPSMH